jgi:hypothetical protein
MSGYRIKDIDGYEGRYAVTDDGRVWSYGSSKWLKQSVDGGSYRKVVLYTYDTPKDYRNIKVHTLVANAFCHKRDVTNEVNHIDGNKSNNHASNLEWVTSSENKIHAWANGLRGGKNDGLVKHQRKTRKLSRDAVITIRQMKAAGWTAQAISNIAGINKTSVFKIVNRVSYKDIF